MKERVWRRLRGCLICSQHAVGAQPTAGKMRKAGCSLEFLPESLFPWTLTHLPSVQGSPRGLWKGHHLRGSRRTDLFRVGPAPPPFPTELLDLEPPPNPSLIPLSLLGKPIRRRPPARPPDKFV